MPALPLTDTYRINHDILEPFVMEAASTPFHSFASAAAPAEMNTPITIDRKRYTAVSAASLFNHRQDDTFESWTPYLSVMAFQADGLGRPMEAQIGFAQHIGREHCPTLEHQLLVPAFVQVGASDGHFSRLSTKTYLLGEKNEEHPTIRIAARMVTALAAVMRDSQLR